ncbi:MAG: YaaA family protein [Prevotella sp.]|nr:YaaA family protein [Prevotella sp.]
MQILLACAKIMHDTAEVKTPLVSEPKFLKEAEHFALLMSQRSVEELMDMFHCSRQLAIDNKLRYGRFFAENESFPAILAYFGQAYKCLQAQTFDDNDFLFAQQHLWITSFLYGLLRPLDMIHPYRMEGKVELDGMTMFNHWKPLLTDLLIDSVKADDGILVHLATEEMQHLFDWRKVCKEVTLVQPQFLVVKNGKLKSVTVYAKSCRGAMTRFIIKNRLHSPMALQSFEYEGFVFKPEYGDANNPYFIID